MFNTESMSFATGEGVRIIGIANFSYVKVAS